MARVPLAQSLSLPPGNSKARIARAKETLRTEIKRIAKEAKFLRAVSGVGGTRGLVAAGRVRKSVTRNRLVIPPRGRGFPALIGWPCLSVWCSHSLSVAVNVDRGRPDICTRHTGTRTQGCTGTASSSLTTCTTRAMSCSNTTTGDEPRPGAGLTLRAFCFSISCLLGARFF